MGIWNRFVRHMDLISTMFARTGAISGLAAQDSEFSLRQAVMRCQACGSEGQCVEFLKTAEQGCEAPSFCNNARLIRRLKQVDGAVA